LAATGAAERAAASSSRVLELARELVRHAEASRLGDLEGLLDGLRSELERCRAQLPDGTGVRDC
jgi:hypothetical protein